MNTPNETTKVDIVPLLLSLQDLSMILDALAEESSMMRYAVCYRRDLKMLEYKIAAQCLVHDKRKWLKYIA